MKSLKLSRTSLYKYNQPGYTSITCSTISNIPYNLIFTTKFNDSSISITIISFDYLNLSLADEHVGDGTIPTQVIKYNQNFLPADWSIRLQYSNKLNYWCLKTTSVVFQLYRW